MSHTTESLVPKSPARSVRSSGPKTPRRDIKIQPNEFFSGGLNESRDQHDEEDRNLSIEFLNNPGQDPEYMRDGFFDDEDGAEEFDPMLNIATPDF